MASLLGKNPSSPWVRPFGRRLAELDAVRSDAAAVG